MSLHVCSKTPCKKVLGRTRCLSLERMFGWKWKAFRDGRSAITYTSLPIVRYGIDSTASSELPFA